MRLNSRFVPTLLVLAAASLTGVVAPADRHASVPAATQPDQAPRALAPQDPVPQDRGPEDRGPAKTTDRAAVVRAGTDYVEALYEARPELIERSVHPELAKYGFYRRAADQPYVGSAMTFAELTKLAGSWNESGKRANSESIKRVEVLDLMDRTAVLKVTAVWGIDHMQLGKFDGRWQIRHILWQSPPAK